MKPPDFSEKWESTRLLHVLLGLEAAGFSGVILLLWLNEVLDLPMVLLGAAATPVNWKESLLETASVLVLAVFIMVITWKMLRRIRHLEGYLAICSSCKRIRDERGQWQHLEAYIKAHSSAEFTHGLCEDCAQKLYPEYLTK